MPTSIEERLKKIIAENLAVDEAGITTDSRIVADLGADSLDSIELVMAIEDEFEITISNEQAEEMLTVRQVIELITAAGGK